jgi:hypothetical protein
MKKIWVISKLKVLWLRKEHILVEGGLKSLTLFWDRIILTSQTWKGILKYEKVFLEGFYSR